MGLHGEDRSMGRTAWQGPGRDSSMEEGRSLGVGNILGGGGYLEGAGVWEGA